MSNRIVENIEIIKKLLLSHKHILNVKEVSILINMSESKIYKLTSSRMIPHYKIDVGSKMVYFKRREIESWLTAYKVKTLEEIKGEVNKYSINKKMKK